MTWVKLDDGFCRNPKIHALPDAAFRLHVAALCYSARFLTDGVIHRTSLGLIASDAGIDQNLIRTRTKLEHFGIWEKIENGWKINDYLEYNPSKQDVMDKRKADAERQKQWRERHAVTNDVTNVVTNSVPSRPVPKTLKRPVDNSRTQDVVRGSWCDTCKTRLAPGVYLEDHQRISHGVAA